MARYHNKEVTKEIGKLVRTLRESKGWDIEDIAVMTGFTYNNIEAIENGRETNTSHLVEIAFAIGVQPSEIFKFPFEIKSRFELSAKRKEKKRLTSRVVKLYNETDFFSSPKFVKNVVDQLNEIYRIKSESSVISVILLRLVKEKKLKTKKVGRQNGYFKK
jgi:transcriptional regulator with XRE-family HTH domain